MLLEIFKRKQILKNLLRIGRDQESAAGEGEWHDEREAPIFHCTAVRFRSGLPIA
jgi:hypothetical protein